MADLLQRTSLIIWDEAPMVNKFYFKPLDRSLRDLLVKDKSFGGMTMVFGGNFRQILPVIPKGKRGDIVKASINSSYLWDYFKIHILKLYMRL